MSGPIIFGGITNEKSGKSGAGLIEPFLQVTVNTILVYKSLDALIVEK